MFMLISCAVVAQTSEPNGTAEGDAAMDREQQQLEWCFKYSNLLGFNITYINNPRLFRSIGEWMGTPYQYSGKSEKGVDCSGFVCEVYRDCYNVVMSGSARKIYGEVEQIKKNDLREGDLVFFMIKRNRVSHVGIYLSEDKFAHASSSKGVIISDLDDPYYKKYYYGAGRLKP